ncbi:hypothetical protein BD779DRAFT_1510231 [Infundibulicybe gibba]|nr:hypothetical protein BD779DRAFT_1510231 [Infundibulicybe gibba]
MVLKPEVIDAFGVLGIPVETDEAEAGRAYKRLALMHHPDRNHGDVSATQRFQQISSAWEICSRHYENPSWSQVPEAGSAPTFGFSPFSGGGYYYYSPDDDYPFDGDDQEDFFRFMFEEMMFNRYSRARGQRYRSQRRNRTGGVSTFAESYAQDQERRAAQEGELGASKEAYAKRLREFELELEAEEKEKKKVAAEKAKDQQRLASAVQQTFQAARKGDASTVRKLLEEYQFSVNKSAKKSKSEAVESLLHAAASACDENLFNYLVDKGADPMGLNQARLTPFHVAILSGNVPLVERLLRRRGKAAEGIHASKAAADGRTPLQLALAGGCSQMVELLLKDATVHDVEYCWYQLSLETSLKNLLLRKRGFGSNPRLSMKAIRKREEAAKEASLQEEKRLILKQENERAAENARRKKERAERRAEEDRLKAKAEELKARMEAEAKEAQEKRQREAREQIEMTEARIAAEREAERLRLEQELYRKQQEMAAAQAERERTLAAVRAQEEKAARLAEQREARKQARERRQTAERIKMEQQTTHKEDDETHGKGHNVHPMVKNPRSKTEKPRPNTTAISTEDQRQPQNQNQKPKAPKGERLQSNNARNRHETNGAPAVHSSPSHSTEASSAFKNDFSASAKREESLARLRAQAQQRNRLKEVIELAAATEMVKSIDATTGTTRPPAKTSKPKKAPSKSDAGKKPEITEEMARKRAEQSVRDKARSRLLREEKLKAQDQNVQNSALPPITESHHQINAENNTSLPYDFPPTPMSVTSPSHLWSTQYTTSHMPISPPMTPEDLQTCVVPDDLFLYERTPDFPPAPIYIPSYQYEGNSVFEYGVVQGEKQGQGRGRGRSWSRGRGRARGHSQGTGGFRGRDSHYQQELARKDLEIQCLKIALSSAEGGTG